MTALKSLKKGASNLVEDRSASQLSYAKQILSQEQKALQCLIDNLPSSFVLAVEAILNIPPTGRLIIMGVGKAGFIGMKLSATFASIGVPSFFLHPTEALHGDLGRLSSFDIVIMLSNSGENSELLGILPYLKKNIAKLITVTASSDSSLGIASDIVVPIGKIQEAGPLGLAPTSSTLALLAIGDALAMTVLQQRPIDRQKFASWHPGGALGRSLLLVSEVMRIADQHCIVQETDSCSEVLHNITRTKNRPGAASVINAAGKLVGVFTDGDLRRCLDKQPNFLSLPVKQVMGQNPKTITPSLLAEEALGIMKRFQIDQLIVIDKDNRPIGMLDIQDLV